MFRIYSNTRAVHRTLDYASISSRLVVSESASLSQEPNDAAVLGKVPPVAQPKSKTKTKASPSSPQKPKRGTSQSSELLRYISKLPVFQNSSDPVGSQKPSLNKYIKVHRNTPDFLYLVDNGVCSTIEKILNETLPTVDPNAAVIEFNPKYGVLTSLLTSKFGSDKVNCFEDDAHLGTELVQKYGVNLIPLHFFGLPRFVHLDKLDGGSRTSGILHKVGGENTSKLYVFGATGVMSLINFTVRSLVTQRVLFDDEFPWKDDVTFFLILGPKPHRVITGAPQSLFTVYRPISVLFQLLFEHETLEVLPRKAFLPWQSRDAATLPTATPAERYKKVRIAHDPDKMFLIKFTPNKKVMEQIGREHLVSFWYFIRHHLYSRKTCVIPQLEQWIPGCGARLIRQGFTIYTQFGSLTPQEIMDVFLQFTSWPEYQSSSFLAAVEKFQSKVESADDDLLDFAISRPPPSA